MHIRDNHELNRPNQSSSIGKDHHRQRRIRQHFGAPTTRRPQRYPSHGALVLRRSRPPPFSTNFSVRHVGTRLALLPILLQDGVTSILDQSGARMSSDLHTARNAGAGAGAERGSQGIIFFGCYFSLAFRGVREVEQQRRRLHRRHLW